MAIRKLVFIARPDGEEGRSIYIEEAGVEVTALNPPHVNEEERFSTRNIRFFLVNSKHVDTFVQTAAKQNPGCEVQVFGMEKVGQCPAGDYVAKDVGKDGILPV